MDSNALSPALPAPAREGRICCAGLARQQSPKLRGASMAENRGSSQGEHSCHPPPLVTRRDMADGVYAPVQPMQAPCPHPFTHGSGGEPAIVQLADRDHAVLALGDLGDAGVQGAFWVHTT